MSNTETDKLIQHIIDPNSDFDFDRGVDRGQHVEPQVDMKLDGAKRWLSYNLREVYEPDEWAAEMSKPAEEIYARVERHGLVWNEAKQRWIDKERDETIAALKEQYGSGWTAAYYDER